MINANLLCHSASNFTYLVMDFFSLGVPEPRLREAADLEELRAILKQAYQ
jgi:hypothetical protein